MARTDYNPQTTTIDDIPRYEAASTTQIENIEEEINKIKNIYNKKTRFFQEKEPESDPQNPFIKGMVWFKIQQS